MVVRDERVDFLRRSYFAVDGLWFVNCENSLGFEKALSLDEAVWKSMAKVQARKAREITGSKPGLKGLVTSLRLKFESEGWDVEFEEGKGEVRVRIIGCPWFSILEKSGREHLEPVITEKICKTEYPLWTGEFGDDISFSLEKASPGAGSCCMVFRHTRENGG